MPVNDQNMPASVFTACRDAVQEIAAIELQISRLGSIGGPGGTSNPDADENKSINKVLHEKKQAAEDLLLKFEKLLDKVPDGKDRAILRYYYGAGWTDERIAEEMELTDRTIRGRRKKVFDQIRTINP